MKFGKRWVRYGLGRWRRVSDQVILWVSVWPGLGEATILRTAETWLPAHRLILQLRCAAPAISSESASEAASWIGCSAAAANGVHGPCRWYDASRLAPRAVWMSRWLAAPNQLHSKSSLCTDALLYRCTARSDGLSAHRSHPSFGARHLVSGCV